VAFDPDQGSDIRSGRTPGREEGEIAVGNIAADEQSACPQTGFDLVVFGGVEVG
jgi:hypothetical protein